VHDDFQRRGVGSALMEAALMIADNWLNITRLELEVYTDNAPAIALYKKYGFEIEGTLRKHAFRDAKFVDSYYMARLKT
jgi:L-phenylalanine/L-methionine N-acetyltransferase